MPISIENLTVKAQVTREGRVLGSRIPHSDIEFAFDSVSHTFNLDSWINNRPAAAACRAAINGTTISKREAQTVLETWGCEESIFGDLLEFVFFDGRGAGNFVKPENDAIVHFAGFPPGVPAGFNDEKIALFMLLATGNAAVYWRENTASHLNIESMNLRVDQKTHTLNFNWESLLRKLRKSIQSRAKRQSSLPDYVTDRDELDVLVFDQIAESSGGFRTLYNEEVIRREPHGNGYQINCTDKKFFGDSPEVSRGLSNDLKLALNHLRFIVYAEWRIAHQLIHKNA